MSQQSSLPGELDIQPRCATQIITWIQKLLGVFKASGTKERKEREELEREEQERQESEEQERMETEREERERKEREKQRLDEWIERKKREFQEELREREIQEFLAADFIEVVYSPTKTFQHLITKIIKWIENRLTGWPLDDHPCSTSDLKIIHDHASILCLDSISDMCKNMYLNTAWENRYSYVHAQEVNELVMAFLQRLNEVFKVPKLKQEGDDGVHRNFLVANFMVFLLQLLMGKTYSKDNLLIEELRSYTIIFLDTPFLATDDETARILLSQFETLANKAGSSVLSFILSRTPLFDSKNLMKLVNLLKANIVAFFNSSACTNTPKPINCAMSSVFIVDSFLYDLENLLNQADDRIATVKRHVEMLHQSLKQLWPLLKEHSDQIDDVKKIVLLAYDAEYLINHFLSGDVSAWYLNIRLPGIVRNVERVFGIYRVSPGHIGPKTNLSLKGWLSQSKIKGKDDVWKFKVDEIKFGAQLSLQTAAGVDYTIVGFEDVELKILEELVGGRESLQIISIFGMPGLGKTTLAKRLYNHPTIRYSFDKFSWSTISQMYKRKNFLVDILMGFQCGVEKATIEKMDDDGVGERIYKSLKGQRYVIVMDDVWELNVWEDIKKYFPNDGNGSRVLFTSRSKGVAPCGSVVHALPLWSNDQCWELLKKKVFHGELCPPQLQHIGIKIATNCRGLPLVVVVVAGILSTMVDSSDWENVRQTLDSKILSYQDNAVVKTLELSYIHLPLHLKPCFLYLGKFQEDEAIHVKTLMQLWIAEGFIPIDEKERAETIAEEYLKQLVDKSLLTVVKAKSGGRAKVCAIHDLLRDMCLKIIKEESFLEVMDPDRAMCDHKFPRLLCQISAKDIHFYGPHIRSFFFHNVPQNQGLSLNVHKMKVLRALDCRINGRYVDCDLVGFQNLIHLRYLAVKRIQTPISCFSSLQFLIIEDTLKISSIILGMRKLRYLRASVVYLDMDCNSSHPNNLEYLSKAQISQEREKWLKQFSQLRRLKCQFAISADEGNRESDLSFFTQLESLTVSTIGSIGITEINFPPSIKKLDLRYLEWSWEKMSLIGVLPNLEILKLGYKMFVGEKWETRDDEFQQLKHLELRTISDLDEWNVSSWEHFPKLQRLILHYCRHLKEIPCVIGEIPTLELIEVYGCRQSVAESVKQIQQQLEEEGNEDHVRIVIQETI